MRQPLRGQDTGSIARNAQPEDLPEAVLEAEAAGAVTTGYYAAIRDAKRRLPRTRYDGPEGATPMRRGYSGCIPTNCIG